MINYQYFTNLGIYLTFLLAFLLSLLVSYKIGYSVGYTDGRVYEKVKRIFKLKDTKYNEKES